jgi:hypothetical protein
MRDAATTTRHLLLGLQAMHTHGVIHRYKHTDERETYIEGEGGRGSEWVERRGEM